MLSTIVIPAIRARLGLSPIRIRSCWTKKKTPIPRNESLLNGMGVEYGWLLRCLISFSRLCQPFLWGQTGDSLEAAKEGRFAGES